MDPALPFREQFVEADKAWGELPVWQTIKIFSGPYTAGYMLNAVDLQSTPDGLAMSRRPTASTSSSSPAPWR